MASGWATGVATWWWANLHRWGNLGPSILVCTPVSVMLIFVLPFVPCTFFVLLLLESEQSMARQNRRDIFDPNEVGCFHAVQRTVRRAWLCGLDPVSGKSFEHRRIWIQNRLEELAASFGIDCLSFAVMATWGHPFWFARPFQLC